jgi:hypothetical protein
MAAVMPEAVISGDASTGPVAAASVSVISMTAPTASTPSVGKRAGAGLCFCVAWKGIACEPVNDILTERTRLSIEALCGLLA